MGDEVFDCVYNLWTGFVGKATCEAGFLRCEEISCPAYTPRSKPKPITNYDRLISKTPEEMAEWMAINTDCFFCKVKDKNICSLDEGTCTEEWLSWLKSPVEVDDGT